MPIVVEGVAGLKKSLKQFAPDLKKKMDAEIRGALRPIIKDARSHVPGSAPGGLYNWNDPGYERKSRTSRGRGFPSYNSGAVRGGLTYTLATRRYDGSGFVSLFSLLNKSATGAIIETAGRANRGGNPSSKSNNKYAGQRFISGMNGIGSLKDYAGRGKMSTGRLLYAAYARNDGRALNSILKSIEETKQEFTRRLRRYGTKSMVA